MSVSQDDFSGAKTQASSIDQVIHVLVLASNISFAFNNSAGIARYTVEALQSMIASAGDSFKFTIFAPPDIVQQVHLRTIDHYIEARTSEKRRKRLALELQIPTPIKNLKPDVVFSPKGFLFRKSSSPTVAVIHDDIALSYLRGEFGFKPSLLSNLYGTLGMFSGLKRASAIVTGTSTSADRLMRYVSAPPTVIPSIFLNAQAVTPKELKDRHFLAAVLGSSLPHKGSDQAFRAAHHAKICSGDPRPILWLGSRSSLPEKASRLSRRDLWIRTAPKSDNELSMLIRDSAFLSTASELEGFGRVPVEAWSLGTPVLAPTSTTHPEILADFPGLYIQGNTESLQLAFEQISCLDRGELSHLANAIQTRFNGHESGSKLLRLLARTATGR